MSLSCKVVVAQEFQLILIIDHKFTNKLVLPFDIEDLSLAGIKSQKNLLFFLFCEIFKSKWISTSLLEFFREWHKLVESHTWVF